MYLEAFLEQCSPCTLPRAACPCRHDESREKSSPKTARAPSTPAQEDLPRDGHDGMKEPAADGSASPYEPTGPSLLETPQPGSSRQNPFSKARLAGTPIADLDTPIRPSLQRNTNSGQKPSSIGIPLSLAVLQGSNQVSLYHVKQTAHYRASGPVMCCSCPTVCFWLAVSMLQPLW